MVSRVRHSSVCPCEQADPPVKGHRSQVSNVLNQLWTAVHDGLALVVLRRRPRNPAFPGDR